MPANGRPAEANVGLFTFQAPKASAAVWRATQNLGLCLLPSQYCDQLTDVSPSCAFSSSEWPYSVLHLMTTFLTATPLFHLPLGRGGGVEACQGKRPQVQCPLRPHSRSGRPAGSLQFSDKEFCRRRPRDHLCSSSHLCSLLTGHHFGCCCSTKCFVTTLKSVEVSF